MRNTVLVHALSSRLQRLRASGLREVNLLHEVCRVGRDVVHRVTNRLPLEQRLESLRGRELADLARKIELLPLHDVESVVRLRHLLLEEAQGLRD